MPTYCVWDEETSEQDEVTLTFASFDAARQDDGTLLIDGRRLRIDVGRQFRGNKLMPGCWPMYSDAMGCNPAQRERFIQRAREAGVPTYIDEHGRPELTSRAHRREYAKRVAGCYDRNAGYSDPTPEHYTSDCGKREQTRHPEDHMVGASLEDGPPRRRR